MTAEDSTLVQTPPPTYADRAAVLDDVAHAGKQRMSDHGRQLMRCSAQLPPSAARAV